MMLTPKQERFWYDLSVKLDIEICVMGVGRWHYVPGQVSTQASFSTKEGELSHWVVRSALHRDEQPWWMHTHPDMDAFMSSGAGQYNDLRGAHAFWENIERPFKAVVLGKDDQRLEVTINKKWLRRHPKPAPYVAPPQAVRTYDSRQFGPYFPAWQSVQQFRPLEDRVSIARPEVIGVEEQRLLTMEVEYLVQKHGARAVYEELDWQVYDAYRDR